MKKVIGLVFCMALFVGCGDDQEYAECSDAAKSGELNGYLLLPDDGIDQSACKNMNTTSAADLVAHESTAVGDKRLCQWSGHEDTDWLCVYTDAPKKPRTQGPQWR